MSTITIDATLFARYDNLCNELHALRHADSALAMAKRDLAAVERSEAQAERSRKSNEVDQKKRREVIERCKSHWFFGNTALQPQTWGKGGVDTKLERQKQKLAAEQAAGTKLAQRERELEQQIAQLQQQTRNLSDAAARKKAATNERLRLFEAAVASAPTPQLLQRTQVVESHRAAYKRQQQEEGTMQQVAKHVAGARRQYHEALGALQRAAQTNRGAQVNNLIGGRNGGMEMIEYMQQQQRNRLMHEAQALASQGAATLQQAFSAIPPALHQRYPQHCAELGKVHLPELAQMGFNGQMLELVGGDIGDAIAGAQASRKIQHNMQILGSCERLIAQQEAIVQGLLKAVHAASQQAAASLQAAELTLHEEKQRIFDALRQRWGAPPPAYAEPAAASYAQFATVEAQVAAGTMQAAWRGKKETEAHAATNANSRDAEWEARRQAWRAEKQVAQAAHPAGATVASAVPVVATAVPAVATAVPASGTHYDVIATALPAGSQQGNTGPIAVAVAVAA